MRDVLRIMTCGSVDDGKSTLIGHLLYDAKLIFTDQKKALELESKLAGSDGKLDYSLLLDGLSSEREQGITIDVAYRYFATPRRRFIVADTPGHEEYTRNMAVGASNSDLAILLIDANKGVSTQTKRHLRICSLMGMEDFVFAVNKMDEVGYLREVYDAICADIDELLCDIKISSRVSIPLSALHGDNITEESDNMPWYSGPALLEYLESVEIGDYGEKGFVMPVQRVSRAEGDFRGLQGQITSGSIQVGESVSIYPGEKTATVKSIISDKKHVASASAGMAVSVEIAEDVDVSRGHVLAINANIKEANMFEAYLLWMDEKALKEGRSYIIKLASQQKPVSVMKLKYRVNIETGQQEYSKRLDKNELGCVDFICPESLVMDSFDKHRALGRFILIDRLTNMTAGCGVIRHILRRSDNLRYQEQDITRAMRQEALGQKAKTIWFTGLSGSGKSELANGLEKYLVTTGRHTMLLDGDNIRLGINKDLGFNEYDRAENIRRVAEISKLMNDAGLIVITAFISPFSEDREMARTIIGDESFIEVYVSTPIEECEKRDVKGLYQKARRGEIPNFTGIGSPYEAPDNPDIIMDTTSAAVNESIEVLAQKIESLLNVE